MCPNSSNAEDLDFDRFTLKIFDPTIEKSYNLFRIQYFCEVLPYLGSFALNLQGIYTLTCFCIKGERDESIIRFLVFLLILNNVLGSKTNFYKNHFYKICRLEVLFGILLNFAYFMGFSAKHVTFNFIIIVLLMTYNLNIGYLLNLSFVTLHFLLFLTR